MLKKQICGLFFVNAMVFLLELKTISAIDKDKSCPVWYIYNDALNHCMCHNLKSWVICDHLSQKVYLARGLCMTFDNETGSTDVGKCPYTLFAREHKALLQNGYVELPTNVSDLNDFMCGIWNREGYLCSKCKTGYGLAIPNVFMNCMQCNFSSRQGWVFYMMLQLVPVLVLFLLILVFRVSIAKPPMNALVTFYQLSLAIIFTHSYLFQSPYVECNPALERAHYASLVSIGIWTMSLTGLIRGVGITDFCVDSNISIQQAFSLTQIKSIFPIFLIAFSWTCIKLYARNFKLAIWLWKPFRRCFALYTKVWNTKLTMVDVFSTFLLLSYSRYIIELYFLYSFQRTYSASSGRSNTTYLLYNPEVAYFDSTNHLPYAFILIFTLLVVAIPPMLILAFYQTKRFQKIMTSIHLHKTLSVNIFVDSFQSCYKNGLDGSYDLRFTASLYMILRMLFLITYVGCSDTALASCESMLSFVWVFLLLLFYALVRPYKDQRMNILDSLLLAMLALISVLITFASQNTANKALNVFVLAVVLTLIAIPQAILFIYVFCKLCSHLMKYRCVKLRCFQIVSSKQQNAKSLESVNMDLPFSESLPDRIDNPYSYCHDSQDF
jgi:hypothetical protein